MNLPFSVKKLIFASGWTFTFYTIYPRRSFLVNKLFIRRIPMKQRFSNVFEIYHFSIWTIMSLYFLFLFWNSWFRCIEIFQNRRWNALVNRFIRNFLIFKRCVKNVILINICIWIPFGEKFRIFNYRFIIITWFLYFPRLYLLALIF